MTHLTIGPSATVVHKFGANSDIDTGVGLPEDIWDAGGAYPFPAAAGATAIVSDDAADAEAGTGARTVRVYGLDSNWADVTEEVTLNGTTSVALTTQFLRVFRAKVLTAGSGETNAGNLAISVGGTTVAQITAGYGQTLMAIFTSAADEEWQLLSWFVSIDGKTAAKAQVALQMRQNGGAWQTKMLAQVSDTQSINYTFPVPFIVGEKTDIRVRAIDVGANDTAISSTFGLVQI